MVEGRRGGTQEDDAGDAEVDGSASVFPSGRHEHRVESGDIESQSGEHLDNRDNADGGHDLVNVDRRADNGSRRRQWHIANHLRGDSSGVAEELSDNLSVRTSRDDKLFQRGIICGDSDSDDRLCDICRSCAEADTDNIC